MVNITVAIIAAKNPDTGKFFNNCYLMFSLIDASACLTHFQSGYNKLSINVKEKLLTNNGRRARASDFSRELGKNLFEIVSSWEEEVNNEDHRDFVDRIRSIYNVKTYEDLPLDEAERGAKFHTISTDNNNRVYDYFGNVINNNKRFGYFLC